jgi:hypothetical protein
VTDEERSGIILRSISPAMPVIRLEESIAFYSIIGFRVAIRFGLDMAIMEREGHRVILWTCLDRSIPLNHYYYAFVPDVDDLHSELKSLGLCDLQSPRDILDGLVLLEVSDPSGHTIRFVSRRLSS